MYNEKIGLEILKSREQRAAFQKGLIDRYQNTLISFTLNTPGPIKDRPEYRKIHETGMKIILDKLLRLNYHLDFSKRVDKITGSEGYISLSGNPREIKKITTEIENNHPLGRLFDIDVFDNNHNQISRRNLGLSPRKCLICDEDAKLCTRSRTHSLEELMARVMEIYTIYAPNLFNCIY